MNISDTFYRFWRTGTTWTARTMALGYNRRIYLSISGFLYLALKSYCENTRWTCNVGWRWSCEDLFMSVCRFTLEYWSFYYRFGVHIVSWMFSIPSCKNLKSMNISLPNEKENHLRKLRTSVCGFGYIILMRRLLTWMFQWHRGWIWSASSLPDAWLFQHHRAFAGPCPPWRFYARSQGHGQRWAQPKGRKWY